MDPFPVTVTDYLTQATFGENALFLSTVSEVHHPQLHSEAGCAGEKIAGQRLLASGQAKKQKECLCSLWAFSFYSMKARSQWLMSPTFRKVLSPLVNALWSHTQTHSDMCFPNLSASCSP